MYKKGTVLVRVKVDAWSSIGIGSIVRLEETATSKDDYCTVTRLKTVELPERPAPEQIKQGVHLGHFIPLPVLKRKKL